MLYNFFYEFGLSGILQNSNDVAFNLKYHKSNRFSNQPIMKKSLFVALCEVRDNDRKKNVDILNRYILYNFDIIPYPNFSFFRTSYNINYMKLHLF